MEKSTFVSNCYLPAPVMVLVFLFVLKFRLLFGFVTFSNCLDGFFCVFNFIDETTVRFALFAIACFICRKDRTMRRFPLVLALVLGCAVLIAWNISHFLGVFGNTFLQLFDADSVFLSIVQYFFHFFSLLLLMPFCNFFTTFANFSILLSISQCFCQSFTIFCCW